MKGAAEGCGGVEYGARGWWGFWVVGWWEGV